MALSTPSRQDRFRLLLPDDLIPSTLDEKYSKILTKEKGYIYKPIDMLNESIQKIQILGFSGGTVAQGQSGRGSTDQEGDPNNYFMHAQTDYTYRAVTNPITLIDKTLNVDFLHRHDHLNYFLLFETFFYQYERDTEYADLQRSMTIDVYNVPGERYCRVVLYDPLIDGIDMLDLDFSQVTASSQTFRVVFKYSNIDFQFIDVEE